MTYTYPGVDMALIVNKLSQIQASGPGFYKLPHILFLITPYTH